MPTLPCVNELVAGVRTAGGAIPDRAARVTTAVAAQHSMAITTAASIDYGFCDRN